MSSILLHVHPSKVNKASIKFSRTFGLGGMAVLLVVIQILTGILLRFYYVASPAEAYNSILFLRNEVLFGQLIRNIHHWSGVFLLMIAFLHLLRVFFTGAYTNKRRINWLFGLILLMLIVFSNFTGYLLPWDQLAYWAITVGTTIISYIPWFGDGFRALIIGGKEVNGGTLQTFYTFHTAVLPFLLLILVIYHFWRVRKAGGVLIPDEDEKAEKIPVMPNLVYKEFIVALVLIAIVLVFATLFNAPLHEKANPAFSMNPTKAPWYFAGIQELLMHFHPFFAAFIIPLGVMAFLAWIPFLRYDGEAMGNWFISVKGRSSVKSTALFAAGITVAGILFNQYVVNFEILMPKLPALISNGIIPLVILMLFMAAYYRLYIKRLALTKAELVQVIFVFIIVAFVVLTLVGIFFRGKDMELTMPWKL